MKTIQVTGYMMGTEYRKLGFALNVWSGLGFTVSGTLGTERLNIKTRAVNQVEIEAFICGWCYSQYDSMPEITWGDVDA